MVEEKSQSLGKADAAQLHSCHDDESTREEEKGADSENRTGGHNNQLRCGAGGPSPVYIPPLPSYSRVHGLTGESMESMTVEPLLGDGAVRRDMIPPWKTSMSLSISFLFVYTGFEAVQNLQSSLNFEENVGVISLAVLYASVMLGSIIGPASARLLGPKLLVLICFLFHLVYLGCNLYPTLPVMVPVSALLGVSISGCAMSEGLFSTASSYSYLHKHKLDSGQLHRVLSMFNGVFYCCFKGTHVSGNLISSVILFASSYNETVLESNVCGAVMCAGDTNRTLIESPECDVISALLGVFMALNVIGCVIAVIGLPSLSVGPDQPSYLNEEVADPSGCFRSLFSVKFLLLTPMFMSQAMLIMIMYTGYTKAFVTCTIGVQWVGYMMISLGVFSAASSLIVNSLVGLTGRVIVFCLVFIIDVTTLSAMLLWQPDSQTNKSLLFILPAIAGVSEGISQPQSNAILASVFQRNLASTFSAFQAVKCLAFALTLAMSTALCLYHQLYLALAMYMLGMLGYVITERRERNPYEQFS